MSLHTYQNNQAQNIGIATRTISNNIETSRKFEILRPGQSIVLDNDPKLARPFNPQTRQWVAYNLLTDLGPVAPPIDEVDDQGNSWPIVPPPP
jgi:hypothetical protein